MNLSKRKVLNFLLNTETVLEFRIFKGSVFQIFRNLRGAHSESSVPIIGFSSGCRLYQQVLRVRA